MSKRITTLTTLVLLIFFASCVKKVECSNAEYCIRNIGLDTIAYCWGCSYLGDSIYPGETGCTTVGNIFISSTKESTKIISFDTDHGNYITEVRECYTEFELD